MSKITIALEAAVATVKENLPADGQKQTPRQRVVIDRAFARILTLIAPRIRHFIRQYGLVGHWEDAEQVCSIAVHRAIEAYEPEKAQFTTFVNWQIRGELQSLRFRLMTDQRPSARKVEATTVSLDAISIGEDGEDISAVSLIEDEEALFRTEAGASAYLAEAATINLIDGYIEHLRTVALERMRRQARPKRAAKGATAPRASVWRSENLALDSAELEELEERLTHNREVVERRLFDIATLDALEGDTGVNKERVRQIAKRAAKTMADLAGQDPRFAIMVEYRETPPSQPTVH
jgi:RNA polymerase sigma-32 factor